MRIPLSVTILSATSLTARPRQQLSSNPAIELGTYAQPRRGGEFRELVRPDDPATRALHPIRTALGFSGRADFVCRIVAAGLGLAALGHRRAASRQLRRSLGARRRVQGHTPHLLRTRCRFPLWTAGALADGRAPSPRRILARLNLFQLSHAAAVVFDSVQLLRSAAAAAGTTGVETLSAAAPGRSFLDIVGWAHRAWHSVLRGVSARLVRNTRGSLDSPLPSPLAPRC